MLKSNTKYTEHDRETIITCVQQNPSNLKAAFEVAGKRIKRSAGSVSQYYYKRICSEQTVIAVASENNLHLGKNNARKKVLIDTNNVKDAMMFAALEHISPEKIINFLLTKLTKQQKDDLFDEIVKSLK